MAAKYPMKDLYDEQINRLHDGRRNGEPWIIITISNLKNLYSESNREVPTYQRRNIVNYLCLDPNVSYRFREETKSRYRAKEFAFFGSDYKLQILLDGQYAQFDLDGNYRVSNLERYMRSKLEDYMKLETLREFYILGTIYEILYNQGYANGKNVNGEYDWQVINESQLAKLVDVASVHIRQFLNILIEKKLLLVNRFTLKYRLITSDEEYEEMSNILLAQQAKDSKETKTNTINTSGLSAEAGESENQSFEYIKEGIDLEKITTLMNSKIHEILVLCDKQQKQIDSLRSRDAQYREDITGLTAMQVSYNEVVKENEKFKNNPLSAPQMTQIQKFVSMKLAEMNEKLEQAINYQISIMKSDPKYCSPDYLRQYQTELKNIIFDKQYNTNILSGFEFEPENDK